MIIVVCLSGFNLGSLFGHFLSTVHNIITSISHLNTILLEHVAIMNAHIHHWESSCLRDDRSRSGYLQFFDRVGPNDNRVTYYKASWPIRSW